LLLPRLFELLAFDPEADVDLYPEVLLSKLGYGNWQEWPDYEQEAVICFLEALWDFTLSAYPFHLDVNALLCGIARSVNDTTSFLTKWIATDSLSAARHLSWFIDDAYFSLSKKNTLNGYYDSVSQQEAIRHWLLSDEVGKYLENAFFRFSESEGAEQISNALQQHSWLTKK